MDYDFGKEAKKFVDELEVDLEDLEELVLQLASPRRVGDELEKIKRMIHSIKGSSGGFDFDLISSFCHYYEDYINTHNYIDSESGRYVDSLLKFKDILVFICKAYRNKNYAELEEIQKKYELISKSSAKKANTKKIRALIAETSSTLQKKIINSLSGFGVEFIIVKDGLEALGCLLKGKFDLFISSVMLPVLEASDIIKILEDVKNPNKEIKIILITSTKNKLDRIKNNNLILIDKSISLENDLRLGFKKLVLNENAEQKYLQNKKIKILVVDDSPDIHKLIDISFKKYPLASIVHCLYPEDSEKIASDILPDLVLLDMQMPLLSGEEVFKIFMKNEKIKEIQIIFLTATENEKEINHLEQFGIKIIKKPFSIKMLASQILNMSTKMLT